MKNYLKLLLPILILALVLVLVACEDEEEEPTPTPTPTSTQELSDIVEIASGDASFETLVTALTAADLVETLQGEGPFTVFAPTDDAFAALPAGTLDSLLADIPALTDVLLYHVVSGKVMAADVVDLDSATTVQGQDITITVEGGNVYLNDDVMVTATDIEASNGVIHVIDAVLIPPEELGDIVDIASADEQFSTLVTALDAADLVETLQGEGPFTVFAPTDDAFAALPAGTLDSLLADIPALTDVLLYHVVSGKVMAADVITLDSATTVQGQDITITVEGGNVYLNDDVMVTATDIEASNGVIHVIDAVLIPPEEPGDIVEIASADEQFSTLVTALDAADLVETLQGEGPFTVFAPTNDAFDALPEGTLEGLLADIPALTDVLLYHVVSGKVMAADVVGLDSATTVQGQDITITVDGGNVYLNDDVMVTATDIEASNGVIHVIDAVLIPE